MNLNGNNFILNIDIKSGINKWGVVGSLAGTFGTISLALAATGWGLVLLAVLSALTVFIGLFKSIRKALSDDYKKSEQRKSADENIENIIDKMKPEMIKNMEPIFDDTTKLIDNIVDDLKIFGDSLENLVSLVNLYQNPLDSKIVSFYNNMKKKHNGKNIFKIISQELESQNISFFELINQKQELYEKV